VTVKIRKRQASKHNNNNNKTNQMTNIQKASYRQKNIHREKYAQWKFHHTRVLHDIRKNNQKIFSQ
jgi:hypothetical protein